MKRLFIIFIVLSVAAGVFAQQRPEVGAIDPDSIGIDAAQ